MLVWIHGGLYVGSSSDLRYNLSGIVSVSQKINTPIMDVSLNYRLSLWGFLQSSAVQAEGSSNAGLLDQRLALRWITENIIAFGGDPSRITVWGESAGAQSIAWQMFAYGGADGELFSQAILESGGAAGASLNTLPYYDTHFDNLTRAAGCADVDNQMACLRALDNQVLYNVNPATVWNPIVDGDFLPAYPSDLARDGKILAIPAILGAYTDEGVSFSIKNKSTEKELQDAFMAWRNYALTPLTSNRLFELYPNPSRHIMSHPMKFSMASIAESGVALELLAEISS